MKKAMLLMVSIITLVANNRVYIYNCPIEYSILYSIASVERHPKRSIGYPYIISFNKQIPKKLKIKLTKLGLKSLDGRSYDCKNMRLCVESARTIVGAGYENIDLGPFQINYMFYKDNFFKYFSLKESYKKACSILTNLIEKYGYTWETIAKYHSFKKDKNLKYLKKLIREKR